MKKFGVNMTKYKKCNLQTYRYANRFTTYNYVITVTHRRI